MASHRKSPVATKWLRCAIWAASNPALEQCSSSRYFFYFPSLSAFLVSFCRYLTKLQGLTFHLCVFFHGKCRDWVYERGDSTPPKPSSRDSMILAMIRRSRNFH